MAFNDLYFFDLEKGVKSLLLYNDKWIWMKVNCSHIDQFGHNDIIYIK